MGINRLCCAAMQVYPDLSRAQKTIASWVSEPVVLSGSGSTLYIPCADAEHQHCVYQQIRVNTDYRISKAHARIGTGGRT